MDLGRFSPYFRLSSGILGTLPWEKVEEIRLRCGRPVEIVLHDGILVGRAGSACRSTEARPCPL